MISPRITRRINHQPARNSLTEELYHKTWVVSSKFGINKAEKNSVALAIVSELLCRVLHNNQEEFELQFSPFSRAEAEVMEQEFRNSKHSMGFERIANYTDPVFGK